MLDRLQEDSWQLELIVSGVVIFLLLGAQEPLMGWMHKMMIYNRGDSLIINVLYGLVGFVLISYWALVTVFLIHLSVRGMWIGAIGLRSVSGDFDFDALNYQPKFRRFLTKRLGSFDDYIHRLDRNASITFSLAFLLFFAILSIGLFFVSMAGIVTITTSSSSFSALIAFDGIPLLKKVIAILVLIYFVLFLFSGLLYLVDFLSFGWFKKRSFFHKLYYPAYRYLSWVTLARLYRPFYYNIIDHRFGRRLIRVYLLAAFVGFWGLTITFRPFPYFNYTNDQDHSVYLPNYVDQYDRDRGETYMTNRPSIGSRFAREDYLEVFLPHVSRKHRRAFRKLFPDLQPLTPSSWYFNVDQDNTDHPQARIDSTLMALDAIHRVYLNDSLLTDIPWKFYEHPVREQPGLLFDLPVYDLPRGEHTLRIEEYVLYRGDMLWRPWARISFMR